MIKLAIDVTIAKFKLFFPLDRSFLSETREKISFGKRALVLFGVKSKHHKREKFGGLLLTNT